jgi:outer membrane receptor protein involved in Fe transport
MIRKQVIAIAIALGASQHEAARAQATAETPLTEVKKAGSINVVGQRLDEARNALSPDTGSTIYRFDAKDVQALPLGDSTPLNQVILHAPGAVQDSFGQLHMRGDHANLQYRVNGVTIPEPIAGFGQAFDTRFADQINILTGALPAQYGYRTAGIVDIRAKGGRLENGGSIGYLGGSHQHSETSLDLHGSKDAFTYYLTGSYLRDNLGIENPTPERNAIHDATRQSKGFGYLSYVIDGASRVSLVFGTANNRFQIPDNPGQAPSFDLAGAAPPASGNLDARQNEKNRFEVLSYQSSVGPNLDYQISLFHRYTDVNYQPDPIGDLVYNGIAANILRRNETVGAQGDWSYRLGNRHTVRGGFFASRERFNVDDTASVFPADDAGSQTSNVPLTIVDNTRIAGKLFGLYLQDEWAPNDRLTINYGARYDHVDTVVKESQLSPRLGFTYDLSKDTRIHAGYARYFTPPPTEKIDVTSIAQFLGTTNALPSDANTAVRSERSNYYDAGVSHQLTPEVTVGLDAYYRDVRHLQDEGQFGNALIFSAFNFEKGKIYGVELSGTVKRGGFSGYANVSYSLARGKGIETGQFHFAQDELDYIASNWVHLDHDQAFAGSAGFAYKWGGTTASLDAIYGSGLRRGFANTEHLPAYTSVNLGLVHAFDFTPVGKTEVRLAVVNLLDKTYELRDGSGIGVGAPQFGPRRGYYVGITQRF